VLWQLGVSVKGRSIILRSLDFGGLRLRFLVSAMSALTVAVFGATNVDPGVTGSARYAWGENAGWVNLYGDGTNGVLVQPTHLQGLAWMENVGWLNFGEGAPAGPGSHYTNTAPDQFTQPNFGVNNNGLGNLWGMAWGENIGWVNFGGSEGTSTVSIDPGTGRFSGDAWGENVGWISFTGVSTADVATVPTSAVPVALSGFSIE
jgi:hypothetical protein